MGFTLIRVVRALLPSAWGRRGAPRSPDAAAGPEAGPGAEGTRVRTRLRARVARACVRACTCVCARALGAIVDQEAPGLLVELDAALDIMLH